MTTKQGNPNPKNRQTQYDVRRDLHLMEHLSKTKYKSIVLSLDAENVFDSVGWEYLYSSLQKFVFNSSVILYSKNLYHYSQNKNNFCSHFPFVSHFSSHCHLPCSLDAAQLNLVWNRIHVHNMRLWVSFCKSIKSPNVEKDAHFF